MRPRRSASSHSCGPHPVVAGGRRVALVEDQVDHLQHRGERARRARRRAAPRRARCFSASVRLARTMRWAIVGSGTRKARAISSVVRPPSRRSVSATRASVRQHRMAGGEDQAQQVVADVVVERGVEVGRRAFAARPRARGRAPRACARAACCGAAGRWRDAWRSSSARRRDCPGCPTCGHCSSAATSASCASSSARPTSRTMRARPAISLRRLDAEDRVDGVMGVGRRHGDRSHHLAIRRRKLARRRLVRSGRLRLRRVGAFLRICWRVFSSRARLLGRERPRRRSPPPRRSGAARTRPGPAPPGSAWSSGSASSIDLHLEQGVGGDQLLRLGEGAVDDGELAAREPDPLALGARVQAVAGRAGRRPW